MAVLLLSPLDKICPASEVQLTYLGCQGPSMRGFPLSVSSAFTEASRGQARKKPSGPNIQLTANDQVKASEEK